MNYDFLFLTFLLLTILFLNNLNSQNKVILYNLLMILTLVFILGCLNLNIDFLFKTDWKNLFIFLVTISYWVMLNLVKDKRDEIFFLIYLVWLGSILIILSNNLLIIYLSIELQTFSLFILISKNKLSIYSSEAGLKYFILGAISSGLLLISMTIIYGLYSNLNLNILNTIYYNDYNYIRLSIIISISLFFKISLFPLHFWIPDIYEGSSTEVLGILSTLPKISIICLLFQLNIPLEFLFWCSLGSIIIGSLGGLNQTKIKRLLGYSGISHIGFCTISLSFFSKMNLESSISYLIIYIVGMIGVIFLLQTIYFSKSKYISELSGIGNKNIVLGLLWSLLILSLAGIPPLSGFLGKWWVIWGVINLNYIISSLIIILFSAVSVSYYLRITKILFFQPKSSYIIWNQILKPNKKSNLNYLYLFIVFYFSIFLILNSSFLLNLVNYNIISLL